MDPDIDAITTKLDKSLSLDCDAEKMEAYQRLVKDAKAAARGGDMLKGLEGFKKAFQILPSQKLKVRIQQLEALVAEEESESEDEFVSVNGLPLFRELHDKLYPYQREGIAFLYGLYRDGLKGGILADDMGLGKTIQIISFLCGMYDAEHAKHTLLVMPTSLITNWTKEFAKWAPGIKVREFHGASKAERTRGLEKVQRRGGAVITTYNMVMNNWEQLASYDGREFTWDYMILDEAHKIKSTSSKTSKSAYAVPAKNRILITGTPVQNNLREMWALFDFACQGSLLGSAKTFKSEYENPITRARQKDATPSEKALGAKMSENLMKTIGPHFLRRTKAEVQKKQAATDGQGLESTDAQVTNNETSESGAAVMPKLTRKNDLVVWTFLSKAQEDIYRQFLSLDHIKELLTTTKSPLAELTVLKKLCDHPRLLSAKAVSELGLQECLSEADNELASGGIDGISDEMLISESGKMTFLVQLLLRLREEGHRTLVFARFRKVLDILQRILINKGFKVLRLDGTINKVAEREQLIQTFQKNTSYTVFLLTTQVGGVGITLTAANRVVIYDPSWNPATDAQAVDRAYRIGQTQNVVIYRLITCGTVEEKIYRRQVFKDSLIRQTTGDKKNPFRYFSKQDLKELFSLQETRSSNTQLLLQNLHSSHRLTDPELDEHIAHLHAMEMFGISDHDLMFSQVVVSDEEDDEEFLRHIEIRVQQAEERMKMESNLHAQLAESMGSSTEPAWLRQIAQDGAPWSTQQPRGHSPSPPSSPGVVDLHMSGSLEEEHDGEQSGSVEVVETLNESVMESQERTWWPRDVAFQSSPVEKKRNAGNLSTPMIDLTLHDGVAENQPEVIHDSRCDSSLYEAPCLEKTASTSICEESISAEGINKAGEVYSMNSTQQGHFDLQLEDSDDDMFTSVDLADEKVEAQQSKLPSQLQASFDVDKSLARDSSLPGVPCVGKAVSASICEEFISASSIKEAGEVYSLNSTQQGHFNLHLESSGDDMFTGDDVVDEKVEARLKASFDVDKSLASVHDSGFPANDSAAGSFIMTKKKKAAVIYDSEEDVDDLMPPTERHNEEIDKDLEEGSEDCMEGQVEKSSEEELKTASDQGGVEDSKEEFEDLQRTETEGSKEEERVDLDETEAEGSKEEERVDLDETEAKGSKEEERVDLDETEAEGSEEEEQVDLDETEAEGSEEEEEFEDLDETEGEGSEEEFTEASMESEEASDEMEDEESA